MIVSGSVGPSRVSLPPSPQMTSLPGVPLRVSSCSSASTEDEAGAMISAKGDDYQQRRQEFQQKSILCHQTLRQRSGFAQIRQGHQNL